MARRSILTGGQVQDMRRHFNQTKIEGNVSLEALARAAGMSVTGSDEVRECVRNYMRVAVEAKAATVVSTRPTKYKKKKNMNWPAIRSDVKRDMETWMKKWPGKKMTAEEISKESGVSETSVHLYLNGLGGISRERNGRSFLYFKLTKGSPPKHKKGEEEDCERREEDDECECGHTREQHREDGMCRECDSCDEFTLEDGDDEDEDEDDDEDEGEDAKEVWYGTEVVRNPASTSVTLKFMKVYEKRGDRPLGQHIHKDIYSLVLNDTDNLREIAKGLMDAYRAVSLNRHI